MTNAIAVIIPPWIMAAIMNLFAHLLPVFSIIIYPPDHHNNYRHSQLNLLQPLTVSIKNKKNGVRALKYNYFFKNVNTGTQKLVSTREKT